MKLGGRCDGVSGRVGSNELQSRKIIKIHDSLKESKIPNVKAVCKDK